MSLRRETKIDPSKTHLAADDPQVIEDRVEDDEFAEASESLIRALEKAGITRSALEATLPEARRLVFAHRCPELASELDQDTGTTNR